MAARSNAMSACAEKLAEISGSGELRRLFVPGRIEFLGKHTDYAGGRSLVCATEQGMSVAYAPRTDRVLRIVDLRDGDQVTFEILPDLSLTIGHWSNYPMTVARRVARNFGIDLRGADIVISSDLPPAAGMSSSSALMPIKQVARAVGYPNTHYFTTIFGKRTGRTPAVFRHAGGTKYFRDKGHVE